MDLCDAAGEGDLNRMQLLLEQGADKGMYDRFGFTPLCIGCWNGHLDVVQHLVSSVGEQGADKEIDKLDGSGMFFFPRTSLSHLFITPTSILSYPLTNHFLERPKPIGCIYIYTPYGFGLLHTPYGFGLLHF